MKKQWARKGKPASFAPRAREKASQAVLERLRPRTQAAGKFAAPCIPALLDHYLDKLSQLFRVIDRPLSPEEANAFRTTFAAKLEEGFRESPHARFVLEYRPSESKPSAVDCGLTLFIPSLEEQYESWLEGRATDEPFGKHADAKVLAVASALGRATSGALRVLDVGAGDGRNTLPLARAGNVVTAVEPVALLAKQIRDVAVQGGLSIEVLEADILEAETHVPGGPYDLIVVSEVLPHFSRREMETLLENLLSVLRPGGTLLQNAFLADPGYTPDALARQAAESVWSTFLTPPEFAELMERFRLSIVSRDDCVEYERAHAPAGAWPPTPWYENWASGRNLFGASPERPPIRLTWLECTSARL